MDQVAPIINSIAWPTITLLCALIFRQQLKTFVESFANKNFEAGLHGLKVTVPVQPRGKQASAKESVPTGPEPAHLPATSTTAATPTRPIATFYDEVFRDFVNFVETNATKYLPLAMSNYSKNKEDTLFQMYVDAFMALQLEKASRYIFGSQLTALANLNASPSGLKIEEIKAVYAASTAAPHVTFDMWLNFLTSWNLAEVVGPMVKPTPAGKCLTPYMQWRGYLMTWPNF